MSNKFIILDFLICSQFVCFECFNFKSRTFILAENFWTIFHASAWSPLQLLRSLSLTLSFALPLSIYHLSPLSGCSVHLSQWFFHSVILSLSVSQLAFFHPLSLSLSHSRHLSISSYLSPLSGCSVHLFPSFFLSSSLSLILSRRPIHSSIGAEFNLVWYFFWNRSITECLKIDPLVIVDLSIVSCFRVFSPNLWKVNKNLEVGGQVKWSWALSASQNSREAGMSP